MPTITLTPAQHAILAHALQHSDGKIVWFPENINGGARQKVLQGLAKRNLIAGNGEDWHVADEGYAALGRVRPAAAADAKPRTRENTKQAEVIRMLQRRRGATVRQICQATGWQAHTVRGTFAGAFKKKLGLSIVSEKVEGGERVYRIA